MSSRSQVRVLLALAVVCASTRLRAETIGVAWRGNLDAAKIEAAQSGRLLLLHFWTRSCAPCKMLDQAVLSQPQVGAAVEANYVPVKIDADASPALAHMFNVDRVPTEVVLTPQGNIVATLSTPDNPDAYVAQLDNLARHFRQTTPGAGDAPPTPAVNAAYAALSQRAMPTTVAPGAVSTATAPAPQSQGNPYVVAAPATGQRYVAAPPAAQVAGAPAGAPPTAAVPSGTVAAETVPVGNPGAVAANAGAVPVIPDNAMPRSYRDSTAAAVPGAAAAVAGAIAGATVGSDTTVAANPTAEAAAAPAAQINPAYAGVANPAVQAPPAGTAGAVAPAPTFASAAPPQPVQVQPVQPPLPPNCPPVAFDGFCPVTLKSANKWAMGSAAFGAIHRGRTYLFVGEGQRQQFFADPDSYSPVFAGYDPVLLLDKRQTVAGKRDYGFKYGNAFYLFSCAETRDKFRTSPQTYAAGVRQAMAKIDAANAAGTILR